MIDDLTFDGKLRLWWNDEGEPKVEIKGEVDLEDFIDLSKQVNKFLEVSDDHKI